MEEPRHPFSLEIITPDRPSVYVNLGPHPPRLWPEDLDRAHEIDLENERRDQALEDLNRELRHPIE